MMGAYSCAFLHRINIIPFLCNYFIDRISSRILTDKHEYHNIGICLKIYLTQHPVMLDNIILNEEYEITLLKCNNA